MTLLLGVDGGNTKTVALVATGDGRVVGAGRAGCSDLYNAGSEADAVEEIALAVRRALAEARARPADVSAAGMGLAGADWPEDVAFCRSMLAAGLQLDGPLRVVNDAITPVYAGSPTAQGVAVGMGTYLALGARGPRGEWAGSWWLPDLGAVELGRAGLHAVCRAELGLEGPTALTERLLQTLGARSVEDLLHQFTRRGGRPHVELGRAAGTVLDVAAAGDATARAIVERIAGTAADYVRVAARRTGLESGYPLVPAGAVFRHPSGVVRDELARRLPDARLQAPGLEPAAGAVLMAAELAGAAPDRSLLAATSPPAAFFDTSLAAEAGVDAARSPA